MLTYKYRLYPTPAHVKRLVAVLVSCQQWYNMCLEERKVAWKLEKKSISCYDQNQLSAKYRKTFRKTDLVFSQTLQVVCADVDKAFKAFFRRVKAGEKPGYPRVKGKHYFNSFAFPQFGAGIKLDGKHRVKVFGVGRIRVRWHRPYNGKIKTVRIKRDAGDWYICFACEIAAPVPLPEPGNQVGLDLNIENTLTDSNN